MIEVYLSLGSNMGDKKKNLMKAFTKISKLGEVKGSHIYRTEPWGRDDLPEFLNACVYIKTELDIKNLFRALHSIEEEMGRKRREKWEERIIDIDLLLSEQLIFRSPALTIPHSYLSVRNFYLKPLSEMTKEKIEPLSGETIKTLLEKCPDRKKVWKTGNILRLKA
jgi:dihydroneopterin aldolase/2-amino-4-hydroxy-6-hydroxymethyldihydropteridine diphosphokinase